MLHERAPVPATLLLTRPAPAAERFLAELEAALGRPVPAVLSPLIDIRPLSYTPLVDGDLILTSANAVSALAPQDRIAGRTAWCVGASTARAARDAGFHAQNADGDAEALIALIAAHRPTQPLVHLHGRHLREDIAARLRDLGFSADSRVIYDQISCPLSSTAQSLLASEKPVVFPVFSPRSAALLADAAPFAAPIHAVAISVAASAPLAPCHPASLTIADHPDSAAMLRATCRILQSAD
jgi:uroporphyrinogen-III synthase